MEILRGDLAELLVAATSDSTGYRFGDRITALRQEGDVVLASFEHAPANGAWVPAGSVIAGVSGYE
ncbi:hypothetical protein [Arthrobacter sp. SLBN-100]|uniref:hypothetical protein n=1 Tax=Arthrobacter sp. SLBN-100 TaxID=2768450 RepID=UPI00190F1BC0|nr:hypothetical protein [Arthrobacter sp. SLBN-100]